MEDQETYLKQTSTKETIKRGIKKLIGELTSVKFMLLCFVCVGIAFKWISDVTGLSVALLLVGLKEVPLDQIFQKFTGKG
jgi:hypothetical protein